MQAGVAQKCEPGNAFALVRAQIHTSFRLRKEWSGYCTIRCTAARIVNERANKRSLRFPARGKRAIATAVAQESWRGVKSVCRNGKKWHELGKR